VSTAFCGSTIHGRELGEDFGGDLGIELSEVIVNVTNIDFPRE